MGYCLFSVAAAGEYRLDHPLNLPALDVPDLLRRYGIRPDKRLGQNFLVDGSALRRIVQIAQIEPSDAILEIGPGLGSLTRLLAAAAHSVVAIELDPRLIQPLKVILDPFTNVDIIEGDILKVDLARLLTRIGSSGARRDGYLVVANIPYYITSAVIRRLLDADPRPRRVVLTLQREVAERITAGPGQMNLLALSVQIYGSPQIAATIPAGAFFPSPQVDSAVVRVDIYPGPLISQQHLDTFFRLAKAGFSQKRKTLRNAMSGGLHMPPGKVSSMLVTAGVDPQRRAETLSLAEWARLVESFSVPGMPAQ